MIKQLRFLAVVCLLFIAAGCTSSLINDEAGKNKILVYGFMNLKDGDKPYKLWIDYVDFYRVQPPTDTPYYHCSWVLGTLYFAFVDPGFYRLESFGAFGDLSYKFLFFDVTEKVKLKYKIPMQGNGFRFEKPGLYYMGTFEIKNTLKAFSEPTFEAQRVYYPSEEDLIVRLLEVTEKGSYWEGVLQKRLNQLRQWRKYYESKRKTG